MTNSEFSNEFDVLYNNIMSNQAPGLDEYEKSVFLTKAQDEIVKSYFDPRSNKVQEGFDGSEKRQIDFSMLMRTAKLDEADVTVPTLFPLSHAKLYKTPDKILMYINESLAVSRDGITTYLTVVPLDYKEYNRLMSKPYKRPLKNQAWRIITSTNVTSVTTTTNYSNIATILSNLSLATGDYNTFYNTIKGKTFILSGSEDKCMLLVGTSPLNVEGGTGALGAGDGEGLGFLYFSLTVRDNIEANIDIKTTTNSSVVELIPGPTDNILSYTVRYIKRPRAIILSDLEGVTLDGIYNSQECELDPILHHEILQRAVELAKAAYSGGLLEQLLAGNQSATDKGYIPQSR